MSLLPLLQTTEPKEPPRPTPAASGPSLEHLPRELFQEHILPHCGKEEWVALKRTSRDLRAFTAGDAKWEGVFRRTFNGEKPASFPTYESAHNCLSTNLSKGRCAKRSFKWHLEPEDSFFTFCEGKSIIAFEHPQATILHIRNMEDSELIGVVSVLSDLHLKYCAIKNGNLFVVFHLQGKTTIKVWDSSFRNPLTEEILHAQPIKLLKAKILEDGVLLHFETGRICFAALEQTKITIREIPIPIEKGTTVISSQRKIIFFPRKISLENSLKIFDIDGTLQHIIPFTESLANRMGSIHYVSVSPQFCTITVKTKIDDDRHFTVWAFDIENQKWLESPIFETGDDEFYPRDIDIRVNYFHVEEQILLIEIESKSERSPIEMAKSRTMKKKTESGFMVFNLRKIAKDERNGHDESPEPVYTDIMEINVDEPAIKRFFDQGKYYVVFQNRMMMYDFTQS